MNRPFKYFVLCNKTKELLYETNIAPLLHSLQTYEPIEGTNTSKLTQTKTAYIDTRYKARLRLYNYITFTKNGLEIPKYEPFKNTEIGKTIPILNF
jgi:hypothetical protein